MKNTHFKKALSCILILCLIFSLSVCALGADESVLKDTLYDTAEYVMTSVQSPAVGSIGGEWAILGLARSRADIPAGYLENYYASVCEYVTSCGGVLHERKYTEYSRLIIALSSIGADPENVSGYNLLTPLGDFEKTIWQGINGPIWALIALDCKNYPMPQNTSANIQATRQMYIDEILSHQLQGGGWSLNADAESLAESDPDITAMALQALSKYQSLPEVKEASDKALLCLSKMQDADGGYSSWGTRNSESVVQVIVALCELGIDLDDVRFVKNGRTLLNNLMSYYVKGEGFLHDASTGETSQMATEQALYGMATAMRAIEGIESLYTMNDVTLHVSAASENAGLSTKHSDVNVPKITNEGHIFLDIAGHKNKTAIEALSARAIINGMTGDLFCPDETMTRAQFSAIIVRALGLPLKSGVTFSDVPPKAWYVSYVETAYEYKIVNGIGDGNFDPEGLITREQAASMAARAAALCGMDTNIDAVRARSTLAPFSDYTTVSDWANAAVAFCYMENIFDADDMNIEPQRSILRSEIAQMIYNLLIEANLITSEV